jgi:hypothetical protein
VTDEQSQIRKIIAASVDYNSYFGAGVGLSIYGYRSEDTQWTAIAGVNQHVERNVDYDYQTGRLRNTTRSFDARAVYDRSGTPRYYGIGNNSPIYNETDYTLLQKYAQAVVGWNLSHVLQIAYTLRDRDVDVEPGTLAGVESLQGRFGPILGVGTTHETLHRLEIIYDTRDDSTIPTCGGQYVIFGGVAAQDGLFDASLYSVTGVDARQLWSPARVISLLPTWRCATCRERQMCRSGACRISAAKAVSSRRTSRCGVSARGASMAAIHFPAAWNSASECSASTRWAPIWTSK